MRRKKLARQLESAQSLRMLDHSLPDEIISEILSPALKVPDDAFSHTSSLSPFSTYSESTSAYLLVSKAWLRVSTPLLYNTVILRSKAQAKALSRALSKNPDLGQFIKKMRVEGGYGSPMHTILKCSPSISDLFISFEIYSSDNSSGLCAGLPLINPTRLILQDNYGIQNKMTRNLVDVLAQLISGHWDSLRIVDLPYSPWNQWARATQMLRALSRSRTLRTVVIASVSNASWVHSALEECPLEVIQIKGITHPSHVQLDDNPALKALVRYTAHTEEKDVGKVVDLIKPSLNPSFIPLNAASELVQDRIWKRILYFAMSLPQLEMDNPKNMPRRLPLLLVSKTFKRLALPLYYAHVSLNHLTSASKFVTILQQTPLLGPHVHTIRGSHYHDDAADRESDDFYDKQSMITFLASTTGLVRFCGWDSPLMARTSFQMEAYISWDAFEILANRAGSSLREFSMPIEGCRNALPTVFGQLAALRSLDWKSCASINCNPEHAPSDGLPNLTELLIWELDPSFLTSLSMMKLPSLRRLVLSAFVMESGHISIPSSINVSEFEIFFQTHGSKLTDLNLPYRAMWQLKLNIFEACPNLNVVSFQFRTGMDSTRRDIPDAKHFCSHKSDHRSLAKIYINFPSIFMDNLKLEFTNWGKFFATFDPKCLPNLREIQVNRFQWPRTERDISKSCWVEWAEILLRHNIYLTDESGKNWRPRLGR
ncbi:hypothetical protein FB451DRAFT_1313700 [Mycena latifolia]|nr:hypothetical protein FB451DRAFT_1313700 [Mycena latifolia]